MAGFPKLATCGRSAFSGNFCSGRALNYAMDVTGDDARANVLRRTGTQPIVLATATLIVVVAGIAITLLWRTYNGISPEQERAAAVRLLQARTAQATEQLVEKTRDMATTQQETIDQLQQVQDQLQSMKQLLAGQQANTNRLSDQVSGLTNAIDEMRQPFASEPTPEASSPASPRHAARSRATRRHSTDTHRKSAKPRS
jgi:hypothetical protein